MISSNKGLQLNAFRLPTDNDGGKKGSWDALGLPKAQHYRQGYRHHGDQGR